MKFIHLADLHLGKKLFGYDLIEEQKEALEAVLQIADQQQVDGVLICGDVYDTAIPPVNAIDLLDWFLNELNHRSIDVFMISGNHDSAGRLGFGNELMKASSIHIQTEWKGEIEYVDLNKSDESVRIHFLPFLRPAQVRLQYECEVENWSDAIRLALDQANLKADATNILLSHQFYKGASASDSEIAYVGTLDEVDSAVLEKFDYAALGHLHRPQKAGRENNWYPGTLLKFSASEITTKKSITMIETKMDHSIEKTLFPLQLSSDFVKIEGTFEQLVSREFRQKQNLDHYFYIVLDDQQEIYDAFEKLHAIYPKILSISYAKIRRENEISDYKPLEASHKTPQMIIEEFFALQNGVQMDEHQAKLIQSCWEALHEAD